MMNEKRRLESLFSMYNLNSGLFLMFAKDMELMEQILLTMETGDEHV
jgi:hypothetical protein